ncbi:MAG: radical SAM protein [Bacteroidales bacterium]|nr:radical SAM protein [Bacteroidales bacterium]
MHSIMEAVPFIGIDRHRIGSDGVGVTTLAAFHGCGLRCRYCLNSRCLESSEDLPRYTPQQLYDHVGVDNLYFIATGGGVCFGGGEPLLHADFITEFKRLCGKSWNLTAETALQVPRTAVEAVAEVVGDFIVDIKESDPEAYRSYTGGDANRAWDNLELLLSLVGTEHVTVRVPLIPQYNDAAATDRTAARLAVMGVSRIDRFTYHTINNR